MVEQSTSRFALLIECTWSKVIILRLYEGPMRKRPAYSLDIVALPGLLYCSVQVLGVVPLSEQLNKVHLLPRAPEISPTRFQWPDRSFPQCFDKIDIHQFGGPDLLSRSKMIAKDIKNVALARLDEGMSTAEVAKFVGCTQRCVRLWRSEDRSKEKPSSRPQRRLLTSEQEEGVLQFVSANPGVNQCDIVEFVLDFYSVVISRFTASRLLKRRHITRKRGTRLNIRYDVTKGRLFLETIRGLYGPTIASIDEMSVMLNSAPQYGYAVRGQRAVIPQPGRRTISFMLTLCVGLRGVIHWSLKSSAVDARSFCEDSAKPARGLDSHAWQRYYSSCHKMPKQQRATYRQRSRGRRSRCSTFLPMLHIET